MNWEWLIRAQSPPREEGCPRHQENSAKPPYMKRAGWSLALNVDVRIDEPWLVSDHPVCAASRHFITCAASPPYKGGDYARPAHHDQFIHTCNESDFVSPLDP